MLREYVADLIEALQRSFLAEITLNSEIAKMKIESVQGDGVKKDTVSVLRKKNTGRVMSMNLEGSAAAHLMFRYTS